MNIILIAFHISAMVLSLVLIAGAVLLALNGVKRSMYFAHGSIVTAGIGLVAGIILLFSSPVLSKCIVLSVYLVAMIAIYGYGFGWGKQSKARLFQSVS